MNYQIDEGIYGPRLVLKGAWDAEAAEALQRSACRELELNYAKGWKYEGLEFLSSLEGLQSLELTHRKLRTGELEPIHSLRTLKRLSVSTYCKSEIRFSEFPQLQEVVLDEWRTRAKSLLVHPRVQKVFLNKYPGPNLEAFEGMPSLESLSLASPRLSEIGRVTLPGLVFLGLYVARKLTSLDGVEALTGLEHLEVNNCPKVSSLQPCAALRDLQVLHVCDDGEIESFKSLSDLTKLNQVLFYGTTNILDGDLDVLIRLPELSDVAFQERRHYSRKRSDLPARQVSRRE